MLSFVLKNVKNVTNLEEDTVSKNPIFTAFNYWQGTSIFCFEVHRNKLHAYYTQLIPRQILLKD